MKKSDVTYGEFDFIKDIREMFAKVPKSGFEGIGDDCAVLPIGDEAIGAMM